jgi:hypothetical protein
MEQSKPFRTPVSEKLDKLYGKNIRCPYCGSRIPKFVSTCENCGISKAQLAEAIVNGGNDKRSHQRIWSALRPADIPFWKMAVGCVFGMFGTHCFISRRWIRGTIICSCIFILFIGGFIFHPSIPDLGIAAHPLRAAFESQGLPVPFDVIGMVGVVLWIWDWFAVLLGFYKYPVIIKIEDEK